jgi:hypothetical protein
MLGEPRDGNATVVEGDAPTEGCPAVQAATNAATRTSAVRLIM